jgi:hypothetical protein
VPSFGNEGGDVGMAQASGFRSLRVRVLTPPFLLTTVVTFVVTLLTIVETGDSVLWSTLLTLLLLLGSVYIHRASVRAVRRTIIVALLLTISFDERVLALPLLLAAI